MCLTSDHRKEDKQLKLRLEGMSALRAQRPKAARATDSPGQRQEKLTLGLMADLIQTVDSLAPSQVFGTGIALTPEGHPD